MYPLNVTLLAPAVGFAVANDEQEHAALTAAGFLPAFVSTKSEAGQGLSRDELLALAEASGIKVDGRWSDARIAEEIKAKA